MRHSFYITILTILGFILLPSTSYACASMDVKTEKACCSKGKKTSDKKKCCTDDSEEKSCDGSCNSASCSFSPVFSSIFTTYHYEFSVVNKIILSEKANFFFLEKDLSFNYFTIWSPPKIS